MEEEFEPTDLAGPVETIEGVKADDDAEITSGQSGFIIIRSFPEDLRRGLPIIVDGAGWSCVISADQPLCYPMKTLWSGSERCGAAQKIKLIEFRPKLNRLMHYSSQRIRLVVEWPEASRPGNTPVQSLRLEEIA
jgi:hypothetical protein